MTKIPDAALDIARRMADGEAVDLSALHTEDPALARRLGKLQALIRTMPMSADAGNSWGHLQQLQLAGQGGFGEVYRAYDPTLDRSVALKLRHEHGAALLPSGRDFVAEARRLARVRHPNVLAVHGASHHNGRAGLWADWIDGETLTARLQRSGPLQGDELLRVLSELADALAAVHRAGLVHGDIKASNVMLDRQGHVILMDFGAGFESSEQGTAISAGTPRYLAPEIADGKPGTLAVDFYAFGVLAHLLATGRYPHASTIDASLRPRALRSLIARQLDSDPSARPRSDRVQLQLQKLIDAPRQRVRHWLLASVVIGLVGIALATTIGLRREQAQRQRAERVSDFLATLYREQDPLARDALSARPPEAVIAEAVTRVETELSEDPLSQAQLLRVLGEAQFHLSQMNASRETLDIAVNKLGDNGSPMLRAEIDGLRSVVASRELRIDDAERHLKSAMLQATQAGGPENVVVGRINALVATSMVNLARYKDAKIPAQNAHRVLARTLGANHPETIQSLGTLGLVQSVLHEDAEAESNVRAAISMIEQRFGTTDARLTRPLHVLGGLLARQRNFDEARATMVRGAEIARLRFGERNKSLASMLILRADMERLAVGPSAALTILGEAEQAMPELDQMGLAQLFSIRGSVHFELGDGKNAETDFREALRLRMNSSGPRNHSAWFVQAQLGDALALQGQFSEAHRLQAEALEQTLALLGPDAYHNTLILTRRAGTYAMQKDWRNSAIHTREAIRVVEKTYGREHHNYFLWNLGLAQALFKLNEDREEPANIIDSLIRHWGDNPDIEENYAELMLLRCDLYARSNERAAARALAEKTLARPNLIVSSEQRSALKRHAESAASL